jgi:glycosyltransferase involved in cell wall biosynthesis
MLVQLPPPLHGASVVNQQVVNSALIRSEFEVEVVPISMSSEIGKIRSFGVGKIVRSIAMYGRVGKRLLSAAAPDLVYFTLSPNGWAFCRDLFLVAMFRFTGRRHVFHLHGRGVAASLKHSPWKQRLYRFAFGRAWVISLARSLAEDVGDLVPAERVFLVPNGLTHEETKVAVAAGRKIGQPPTILFVGNMLEQKGPLVLLDALALLASRGCDFDAEFAGAWRGAVNAESFAAKVRALGLEGRVTHRGVITGAEKTRAFADAEIFAFPTYYDHEAFPLVIIEAMMRGLAVVSTYVGAIPEILDGGATGELVPEKDPVALAEALERLLRDDGLRARYGRAARAKYEAELTGQRFEQNLAAVFRAITAMK